MAKKKKETKKESVEKEFRFSGSPARLEGEDFEEYKERRKMLKALEKQKLKGETVWHSKLLGKYLKSFKGHEKEIYKKLLEYQRNQQNKMDSDSNSES